LERHNENHGNTEVQHKETLKKKWKIPVLEINFKTDPSEQLGTTRIPNKEMANAT